jgi:hypothetical protein
MIIFLRLNFFFAIHDRNNLINQSIALRVGVGHPSQPGLAACQRPDCHEFAG